MNESVNFNINSSLIERNEEFLKNKNMKINSAITTEDLECTFAPRINNKNINKNEEFTKVGDRLYQYKDKYQKSLNEKKEIYQENHPYKPEISKNTYEILKQRDIMIEDIKNKYSSVDASTNTNIDHPNSNSQQSKINKMTLLNTQINEIQENPCELNSNSDISRDRNQPQKTGEGESYIDRGISNKSYVQRPNKSYEEYILINYYRNKTEVSKKGSSNHNITSENNHNNSSLSNARHLHNNNLLVNNLSDSKLLDIANHYITTDESLEKFQARLRDKYKNVREFRDDYVKVVETNLREKTKINKCFNATACSDVNKPKSKEVFTNNLSKKGKEKDKMPKNISTALEYYNIISN